MRRATRRRLSAALAALIWLLAARPSRAELPELGVDLHAHLSMKPALGWLFRGSFDEPLVADSWDDRLGSKINAEALEASGAGVVVVALFAHPVYALDMRQAVREQIAVVERFAAHSPRWSIAKSSREAERLLESGQRVLVLSLEGAAGVLESEEDLREFIDERGIAIVTPLHLVDDRYGGAAVLGGFQYLANPLGMVERALDPDCEALAQNRRGITPLGLRLVSELVRRGVWIDLTHAPERALEVLVKLLEPHQPLLVTHAVSRRFRSIERASSDALLARVGKSGGMVGLLPSEDAWTPVMGNRFCPPGCEPARCTGSVHAFAASYAHVARLVGARHVALGSDFNGGMRHLGPACHTGTSLDREPGLFHMGQEHELWRALQRVGAPVPPARQRLATFLAAWARVRPSHLEAEPMAPALPSREDARGPSLALSLGVGMGTGGLVGLLDAFGRKDTGFALDAEPTLTFLHLSADVTKALDEGDGVPFLYASLAPLGIRARAGDSRVEGEALPLSFWRRQALDQALVTKLSLLRGAARAVPGGLGPGSRENLFVELSAELLGFKEVRHLSARERLEGLALVGGGLRVGATLRAAEAVRIIVDGGAAADVNFTFPSVQSDIDVGGGLTLWFDDAGIAPFLWASWLANRETRGDDVLLGALRVHGGVRLTVF